MQTFRRLACIVAVALVATTPALAQSWPSKPIRIVVPFVPGSFTDTSARAYAQELTEQLGVSVVVENKGGAGGTIGADAVAKSAPDGYTLVLTDNSFVMAAALYPKLPYDPVKDFTQIAVVAESPSLLMVKQDLEAKNLKELQALAKAKPAALNFGSGGQGSSAHLATELFLDVAGIRMTHVPYKGVAAAIGDVVSGRLDTSIASLASGVAQIKAGRIRGLAVSGSERHPLLPDVPTFAEQGFDRYDMSYWWGIAAPAGTPNEIVARLNQELGKAAAKAKLKEAFATQGARPLASTPQQAAQRVEREIRVWKDIVSRAGVTVQ
jgi:tripartite-type tricarboxylate transporter receptor subunit TctC